MAEFGDDLASLCRREMIQSRGDDARRAAALERMGHVLGCMVAEIAEGQPAAIDELMTGTEAHAHEAAVSMAPLIQMMAMTRRKG